MLYCLHCKDCCFSRGYLLLKGAERNARLHKELTGHERVSITEKLRVRGKAAGLTKRNGAEIGNDSGPQASLPQSTPENIGLARIT